MSAPFLSLALATYNRWESLERVLAALLPQLDADTELVISDNASPNGQADKCAAMCAKHDNVRIVRQQVNVGALRNYQAAFEACTGDYILCLADDDVPTPGFVSFVKNTITTNRNAGIYQFEPNPTLGTLPRQRNARAGLDAILLIFACCGMMPGMTFPRGYFDPTLWQEPNIYPQVLLATTLARDHGAVLASGPEGLILGGADDTAVNRARSRPTDFGISERLGHLFRVVGAMPKQDQLKAMNCGVHDLVIWGWTVFEEMWIEDKIAAARYVTALMRIDHVRTSPYTMLSWFYRVRRSPTLWHSALPVLPMAFLGILTMRFWSTLLKWDSMKVRKWGTP